MQKEQNKSKRLKKPYHIKKADLDLAGYKKDLEDRSPAHLFQRAVTSLRTSRQFHLYLLLQVAAAIFGYGQFMFCIGSSNFHSYLILNTFTRLGVDSRLMNVGDAQAFCGCVTRTLGKGKMGRRVHTPFSTKTSKRMVLHSSGGLPILTSTYSIDGATNMEYLDREIRRQIY